ncbi:hypothetical protein [Glutamicibacter ardleyensis]|uniref:hypothetical protein n=1 Tax=Glutamicibacter ardleyensis TaxID=225894 RepID=UPI003FD3513F
MSVENLNENAEETQSQDDLVTTDGTERESTEVVSNIVLESSKPDGVDNEISLDENLETAEDAETFPRSYVEKLRKEAAGHRDRAKRADDLAARLHTALVEGTGRLADARDLPFDESHLDDPVALSEAIDAVLADKPHLATRKPMGNIGQGVAPVSNDVSLGGILRAGAM